MLGADFTRTVRAAQAGDVEAFVRLWRDTNPVLVRYLRVVGHDDPYDGACEGWVNVVRGLPDFRGDESAWRVWLLQCARLRAQDGLLRRAWGSSPGGARGKGLPAGEVDPLEVDELYGSASEHPRQRGIGDTLAALRALPLGQGEVVVLRLGAGLSVSQTGTVVQSDDATVRRLEGRALERLAVSTDLLAWSLDAPATPAELADERVVLGQYRAMPVTRSRSKIVAIGTAASASAGRGRHPGAAARGTSVVRHSRAAVITIAALSASVMSLGGITAAAYVGALPDPIQDVLHRAIGAPAPDAGQGSAAGTPRVGATSRASGKGPDATSAAAAGLCRAWAADKAKGTPRTSSVAFRNLASAAGGAGRVEAYCATALKKAGASSPHSGATKPGTPAPTSSTGGTASASQSGTPDPGPTRTNTPNPNTTRTGTPNSNSTKTGAPSTKTRTNTPNTRSTQSSPPTSKPSAKSSASPADSTSAKTNGGKAAASTDAAESTPSPTGTTGKGASSAQGKQR